MTTFDTIQLTKAGVLERLRSQLDIATKYDAERLATHRKDEAAYLKAFRTALKDAAKWDYKQATTRNWDPMSAPRPGRIYFSDRIKPPQCPIAIAPRIQQAIRFVELDGRRTYSIGASGIHRTLFELITWTPTPEDFSGGC